MNAPTAHSETGPLLLTIRDTAQLLSLSPRTVDRWVRMRKMPHYKLGAEVGTGRIRIARTDLDTFLAGCRRGGLGVPR